jgi:hypothetical protein
MGKHRHYSRREARMWFWTWAALIAVAVLDAWVYAKLMSDI